MQSILNLDPNSSHSMQSTESQNIAQSVLPPGVAVPTLDKVPQLPKLSLQWSILHVRILEEKCGSNQETIW